MRARTWIAVALLGLLSVGGLVTFDEARVAPRLFELAALAVLLPTMVGLARRRWWARWLGLGVGFTWSLVAGLILVTGLAYGGFVGAPRLLGQVGGSFTLGLLLIACLAGPRMFDAHEGQRGLTDDGRLRLVRATVIAHVAALSSMLAVSLEPLSDSCVIDSLLGSDCWRATVVAMAVVVPGLFLLARQRTAGLLLVAAGCAGEAAALVALNASPLTHHWGALVADVMVLPGLLAGLATTAAYARPIWRFLRR